MAKTIVLFHGELNTLNVFTDELRQGFEELGYDIFMFEHGNSVACMGKLYEKIQAGEVLAMIGFNSAFFGFETQSGINVWEQLQIPCINILVDHPYWYTDILDKTPANGIVLCIDRNHMTYVNRYFSHIGINGFLPHGGTMPKAACKPMEERTIDVLYAGSLYTDLEENLNALYEMWDFDAKKIVDESIEYLLIHHEETIEAVLEKILCEHGILLDKDALLNFLTFSRYIERVVSSHYREKVVGAVAKAGIKLTLYGKGWENCGWITLPTVSYGGLIAPEEVLTKMEDTKIVLNNFPWFKDGSHERIFNGMLRGCVVVTDWSAYVEETIPDTAICSFKLSEEGIGQMTDRIKDLLADTTRLSQMAEQGKQLAKEKHTWQMRAKELHEDLLAYL